MSYTRKQNYREHIRRYGFKGFLRVLFIPFFRWLGYGPELSEIDVDVVEMLKSRTVMQRTLFGIYSLLQHKRGLSLFDVWGSLMTREEIDKHLRFLIRDTDYRVEKYAAEEDSNRARTKIFYILTGLEVLLEKNVSNAIFAHGYEMLLRELWQSDSSKSLPPELEKLLEKLASKTGGGVININKDTTPQGFGDSMGKLFMDFLKRRKDQEDD